VLTTYHNGCLLSTLNVGKSINQTSQFETTAGNSTPTQTSNKKTLKTILMWSNWDTSMSNRILTKAGCSVTSCLFTPDVTMMNKSDIVVIYIDTSTNFPLNRHPNQRFVFFNLEPPHYSSLSKISDQRVRYGYFNWTMTYRLDSDIIHRSEYGFFVKKTNEMKQRKNSLSVKNLIKQKTKLVAWFVSNCFTPIRREEFVQQLIKYIPVDIFGSCTMKNCSTKCYDMLRSSYKFYLAFENTWCPDYVTEKFYRSLKYDTVPIVMGGADYKRLAPPYSYINVKDFGSPKELAEYIFLLDNSDELYAKYFDWKKRYLIKMPYNYGLCELCRMAHDEDLPPKTYQDIKKWWFDTHNCQNSSH
jgi:alpha-1,3-fucosyltransferase